MLIESAPSCLVRLGRGAAASPVMLLVLLVVFIGARQATAQCFSTAAVESFGGENVAGDLVGDAVAISGDTVVIGAPGDDSSRGAAFVYIRSGLTWVFQQKLIASDRAASDRFGESVAITGNTILIGAGLDDNANGSNAGGAYIFERSGTTWTEVIKFTAFDGAANDNFGSAVAFASLPNRLVALVGAPRDGSVYIFSINTILVGATWGGSTKFAPTDAPVSFFGVSLSAAGSTAAVGTLAGRAYVFTGSTIGGWTQQQRIDPPAEASTSFGSSVGYLSNTLIVGDSGADTPVANDAGAAHVFVRSGGVWTEEQRLFASDGETFDNFGIRVAVSGDHALIGANFEDAFGDAAGAAFIFSRNGTDWTQRQKFYGLFQAGERFGTSVAIQGSTTLVGASRFDASANVDAGRAYIHEFLRVDITTQPASTSTCLTGSATFTAATTVVNSTASYQWQYRPGNIAGFTSLVDGPNMDGPTFLLNAAGASTPALTVDRGSLGWNVPGPLLFRLLVSSPDCPVGPTSTVVTLTICKADFNCSGDITVQDLFDFLADYFAGILTADVNASGTLTVQDVFDFLAIYFIGCA